MWSWSTLKEVVIDGQRAVDTYPEDVLQPLLCQDVEGDLAIDDRVSRAHLRAEIVACLRSEGVNTDAPRTSNTEVVPAAGSVKPRRLL